MGPPLLLLGALLLVDRLSFDVHHQGGDHPTQSDEQHRVEDVEIENDIGDVRGLDTEGIQGVHLGAVVGAVGDVAGGGGEDVITDLIGYLVLLRIAVDRDACKSYNTNNIRELLD